MVWDLGLLAILIANVLRSAQRGGRVVGIELACFSLTYATTFLLAPGLAHFIGARASDPPPFLSLLVVVILYFAIRRPIRMLTEWWIPEPHAWHWPSVAEARLSRQRGACLGLVRGTIVVLAIALVGGGLARMQAVGMLQMLPPVAESRAVESTVGFVDVLVARYTREAGPTTRQLVALTLEPSEDRVAAFLRTSFVQRIKTSDEMIAFAKNPEILQLIEEERIAAVVAHPAFLRVISLAITELRNEEMVVAQI